NQAILYPEGVGYRSRGSRSAPSVTNGVGALSTPKGLHNLGAWHGPSLCNPYGVGAGGCGLGPVGALRDPRLRYPTPSGYRPASNPCAQHYWRFGGEGRESQPALPRLRRFDTP